MFVPWPQGNPTLSQLKFDYASEWLTSQEPYLRDSGVLKQLMRMEVRELWDGNLLSLPVDAAVVVWALAFYSGGPYEYEFWRHRYEGPKGRQLITVNHWWHLPV